MGEEGRYQGLQAVCCFERFYLQKIRLQLNDALGKALGKVPSGEGKEQWKAKKYSEGRHDFFDIRRKD